MSWRRGLALVVASFLLGWSLVGVVTDPDELVRVLHGLVLIVWSSALGFDFGWRHDCAKLRPRRGLERECCTGCGEPLERDGNGDLQCVPCDRHWSQFFPPSRLRESTR